MRKNVLIFYMGLLFYSCFFVSSVFPAELSEDIEEEETPAEISQEKKSALLEVSVTSTSGNSETASIITGADFSTGHLATVLISTEICIMEKTPECLI